MAPPVRRWFWWMAWSGISIISTRRITRTSIPSCAILQGFNSTRGVKWEIIPDLHINFRGNLYIAETRNQDFRKELVYGTGAVDLRRPASASYSRAFQQQHNVTLNYLRSFARHNASLLVGGESTITRNNLPCQQEEEAPPPTTFTPLTRPWKGQP